MSTTLHSAVDALPAIGLNTESHPKLRRILVSGDALAIAMAWGIALSTPGAWLAIHFANPTWSDVAYTAGGAVVIVVASLLFMAMERLYLARVCSVRTMEIARITRVSVVTAVAAIVVCKVIDEAHLARVPILAGMLTFIFLNVWRVSYASWLSGARKRGHYVRSVILVGANYEAFSLYTHIAKHPELGYRFYGFVGPIKDAVAHDFDIGWLGETDRLPTILEETGIKGAFVVGGALGSEQLNQVLRKLLDDQVHVHLSTGVNGIDHRRMRAHSVAYEPLVYVERADLETWQLAIKRVIDITLAGTMLLLASPLLLLTTIAIRIQDRGPILFRQERVGHHGKPFTMYKFRSMVTDAESRLAALREDNARSGPLFKLAVDPRVTRLGKILRATSIDELPQLWNVTQGHMSLVGPRPALASEVQQFEAKLQARQNVKPGITGLWQVEARDNPDFSLYQRLDLFYVENWSVALDLAILTATAKVVVVRGFQSFGRFRRRHSKSTTADVRELVLN